MKTVLKMICLGAVGVLGVAAEQARADASFPNFTVPAFFGQPETTYQEWFHFTSVIGPNTPGVALLNNPNGSPTAFDANAPGSEAFLTGGNNIYSPTGTTLPTMVIPNYGHGNDWTTQIVLQTQTIGNPIDFSTVQVTPLGGSPVTVLPGDITLLAQTPAGPGGFMEDYRFVWTLPGNAASYTVSFSANQSSSSWAGARVDTLAVPEPASLGVLGVGAAAILWRRRRGR